MVIKTPASLSFTSYYSLSGKRYIGLFLLLVLLLPTSLVWATPAQQPSWRQNMTAGVEVGFGVPYGWIVGGVAEGYRVDGDSIGKLAVSPNVRLGAVWGYGFPLGRDIKLGPEVGLAYSMTKRFQLPSWGITIEERYLQIPVGIKVSLPTQWGVIRQGLMLGYEFDILLSSSSKHKHSGAKVLSGASLEGEKDLKEAIPDLSKLTGSIFLDSTIDFPKGFYFMMRVRFPVVEFMAALKKEDSGKDFSQGLDSSLMHLARICSTSLIEFNVGVDILKWF